MQMFPNPLTAATWLRSMLGITQLSLSALLFTGAPLGAQENTGADAVLHQMAIRAFNDGSFSFAQTRFRKLLEDFPSSSLRPSASYYGALCHLYQGDLEKSRSMFDDLARLHPSDPLTAKSRLHVVKILLAQDKPGQAVEEARSGLKRYVLGPQEGEMHLLLAQAYFRQGLDDIGHKELTLVGDNLRDAARFETAMLHQKRGRFESAQEILADLSVRVGPAPRVDGNPEPDLREKSLFWLMKTFLSMQKIDDAITACSRYVTDYGTTASPLAAEGRFLKHYLPYEKPDYPQAEGLLTTFLQSEPDSPFSVDARYFLARCQEETGQDVLALAAYQEIIQSGPKGRYYGDALGRALRLFARRGDEVRVGQTLSNLEAMGSVQGREGPIRELAAFYVDSKPDRAEAWYRKLLSLGYKNPENLKGLSYALLKQGRMEDARRTLLEAADSVKGEGEKAELLLLLAENDFEAKNYPQAAEAFKRVADRFPTWPRVEEALDGQAWSLYQQKQYDGAWTLWNGLRGARKPSIRSGAWFAMAESSRLGGHPERAAGEYEAFALNFPEDPRTVSARQKNGRILYDQKAYEKAFDAFQSIHGGQHRIPDRILALYWMGWCRLQQKKEADAVSLWLSLTNLDPQMTDPRTVDGQLVCAKTLLSLKRPADARLTWERLVAVLPSMTPLPVGPLGEAWWQLTLLANREDREGDADLCFGRLSEVPGVSTAVVFSAAAAVADRAMERRRDARALDYYGKALDSAPTPKERRLATFWKGVSLKQTGRLADAKETFQGLVAIGPENGAHEFYWQAMMEWADVASGLGESAAAEKAYKLLSTSAPDQGLRAQAAKALSQGQGRNERGQVMNEEDPAKLAEWARKANDREAKALANLKTGRLLAAQDKYQPAVEALKQGANLSTGETGASAQTELVRLLHRQGQYELAWQEGLAYFYQFDRYRNDEAELLFLTADSARRTGQTQDAARLGEKLKRLYGATPWGQKWAGSK